MYISKSEIQSLLHVQSYLYRQVNKTDPLYKDVKVLSTVIDKAIDLQKRNDRSLDSSN